jgi:hypothetical protein
MPPFNGKQMFFGTMQDHQISIYLKLKSCTKNRVGIDHRTGTLPHRFSGTSFWVIWTNSACLDLQRHKVAIYYVLIYCCQSRMAAMW